MNIKITGITLLSTEEAENIPIKLRSIGDFWWLRSPGYFESNVATVRGDGRISLKGYYVDCKHYGVRPALIFDPASSDLQIGDKFDMAEHKWTVIAKDKILCDDIIGQRAFREDWEIKDANNYETSDIKIYLENWAKENYIIDKPNIKIYEKMSPERMKELLNFFIDNISVGETCHETIKKLLFIGFKGSELVNEFQFSEYDVQEALGEMDEYEY